MNRCNLDTGWFKLKEARTNDSPEMQLTNITALDISAVLKRASNWKAPGPDMVHPAPLPIHLVKDAAIFKVIGVDFPGPVYLRGQKKAWICLYTCAIYRAVHLELVSSLSTNDFLASFRRFLGCRGRPTIVLGKACLTYEEMYTVLCDCELTLNSRPLTYVSEEPSDLKPLTPAMFLHDIIQSEMPDLDIINRLDLNLDTNVNKRSWNL
ncbi:uncharacterized protein LOC117176691 [Belonocnema kinseyi]|uniref:uncharacterized protein LOC117176691 n=1 Tax=Belonocnema kinseyi TaxID=2817044 RepID=UPI00143DD825|nr:uncharacterized protein LOC117176691 [Belonocnema kinseyi]